MLVRHGNGNGRSAERWHATTPHRPKRVLFCTWALLCIVMVLITLYPARAQEANLILNPDFTMGTNGAGVPIHWIPFSGVAGVDFLISDERSTVGATSVKMVDSESTKSVGLRSSQVQAKPGQRFAVEVDVFVEQGMAMLYLDFLDARGQRVIAHTNSAGATSDWTTLAVEGVAPEGTAFVTVILYQSLPNQGTAYFDNVRLVDVSQRPVVLQEREATNRELGYLPEDGSIATVNPPPLVWLPTARATSYTVELSPDPTFPVAQAERITGVELPIYTHSRVLEPGTWYWRYWAVTDQGQVGPSQVRSFVVTPGLTELPLPPTEEWMARIPTEHPRIFLRPEEVQPLRDRLNVRALPALFTNGHLASLIGADLPPEPVSPYAGGALDIEVWRQGTAAMVPVFDTLEELAFLYMMTQDERYGVEGKKVLLHLASMDPSGATSYRGAPEVAMRAIYFIPRAYSWLHDTLTEEEREIVRHSARVRGQEAYNMIKGLPFETSPYSSHPGRMLGFLGQLSIVFLDEIPEARGWLEYVVNLLYAVYPAWGGADGGYSEGNSYWRAYMSWMFDFLDAFKSATGIDLYQKPFFQNTGYFALYTLSPRTGQAFSDSHNGTPGAADQAVMTHLARVHDNPYFSWYVNEIGGLGQRSKILSLITQDPMPTAKAPTDLPDARWFRDVGWVALHRDLANPSENIQFTFKGSPFGSASHSHSDQNAFVLYAYGDGLAVSTGYYPWSRSPHHAEWTNQTLSKNSLLIDGRGQPTFDVNAPGQILGLFHSGAYDYTAGEASQAYANSNLKRFARHVVYLRPDMFLIVDDVRADNPVSIDWLLHSRFAIEWDQDALTAHVEGRSSELDVYMLTPQSFTATVSDQYNIPPETASYQKEWHMTAKLEQKVDEVAIVSLLVPKKLDADGPEVLSAQAEVTGNIVRVDIEHRTGGTTITETVWLQLPPSGSNQVAAVQANAADKSGILLKALTSGEAFAEAAGITKVTEGWSAAAMWDHETNSLSIQVGRTDADAQQTIVDTQGVELTVSAPFEPTTIKVNGENATWTTGQQPGTLVITL